MDLRICSSLPDSAAPQKRKYEQSDCEDEVLELKQPRKTKKQYGTKKKPCSSVSHQLSLNSTKGACDDTSANSRQKAKSPNYNVSKSISFLQPKNIAVIRNNFTPRCEKDFGKMKLIGIGGFGKVYRATNKIDGAQYAIKKVKLSKKEVSDALREVKILAMLNHPNVVVYTTAWIETCHEDSVSDDEESSSSSCISLNSSPQDSSSSSVLFRENHLETIGNENEGSIDGDNEKKHKLSKDELIKSIFKSVGKYWDMNLSKESNLKEHDLGDSQNEEVCPWKPLKASVEIKDIELNSSGDNSCEVYESFALEPSQESFSKGIREHSTPNLTLRNILHIQMHCYEETLKDWLDKRNFCFYIRRDESRRLKNVATLNGKHYKVKLGLFYGLDDACVPLSLHVFLYLLKGVKYIHSMGIIHHDLKPSNIFVERLDYTTGCKDDTPGMNKIHRKGTASNYKNVAHGCQIRIGDFGLACCKSLPKTSFTENYPSLEGSKGNCSLGRGVHEAEVYKCRIVEEKFLNGLMEKDNCLDGIGTKVYAAPEQLQGHCHPKSDLYSLGIILFEILVPFKTYMERAKVLSDLRLQGNVPKDFSKRYPILASVVQSLLDIDPERRIPVKTLKKKIQNILKLKKC